MEREMSSRKVERALFFGLVANGIFFCIEVVGGVLSNSTAVLSDALHDFTDIIALLFSWGVEKLDRGKRPAVMNKVRLATALVNALVLGAGSLYLVFEALVRLQHPEPILSPLVIGLSILGIFFNGFIFFRLRDPSKKNMNVRVILFHYLEDVCGWVTILAGAIIMTFTGLLWVDSIITIGYSLFILFHAFSFVKQTLREM